MLWASFFADVNLEDRLVGVRHGRSDGNVLPFLGQTVSLGWAPFEHMALFIIHGLVQVLVTGFAHIEDSHCVQVLVPAKVVWHREHHRDSTPLGGPVLEVVGKYGHGATRCVTCLDEESFAFLMGLKHGRQGIFAGAFLNVCAGETERHLAITL